MQMKPRELILRVGLARHDDGAVALCGCVRADGIMVRARKRGADEDSSERSTCVANEDRRRCTSFN